MRFIGFVLVLFAASVQAADSWTDISSALLARLTNSGVKPAWPGGCSGVVANRLTGEVTVKVVGCGLWRSSDQGKTWQRLDDNTTSGRDETGWATSVDQNAPARMTSFSLDGTAGWTSDGRAWTRFTSLGRNWDFGSVDWSASAPKTIIAAKHETSPPGEVYLTTDGGTTWTMLAVYVTGKPDRLGMVGALDGTILIRYLESSFESKDLVPHLGDVFDFITLRARQQARLVSCNHSPPAAMNA